MKEASDSRDTRQIYLEDSADVYWTRYPDPFSPPTYKDTFHVSGTQTFTCKLEGQVEIGLIRRDSDNIVYSFPYDSKKLVNGSGHFRIFYVESYGDTSRFPVNFYRSTSDAPLSLILILDGRQKAILPVNLIIPPGNYCFINYSNHL